MGERNLDQERGREIKAAPQLPQIPDAQTTQRLENEIKDLLAPDLIVDGDDRNIEAVAVERLPESSVSRESSETLEVSSNEEPNPENNIGIPVDERINIDGREYTVSYVSEEDMPGLLGFVFDGNTILIRSDIPHAVQRFVKAHELGHIKDKHLGKGGWIMDEVRATIGPGLRDPIGLLSTLLTILKKGKLKFYWNILKTGQLTTFQHAYPPAAVKVLDHKYGSSWRQAEEKELQNR